MTPASALARSKAKGGHAPLTQAWALGFYSGEKQASKHVALVFLLKPQDPEHIHRRPHSRRAMQRPDDRMINGDSESVNHNIRQS
jgi:hypothetical protein